MDSKINVQSNKIPCISVSLYVFIVFFTKEKSFTDFLSSSLDDKALEKWGPLSNENKYSEGSVSFLQILTPHYRMAGENKSRNRSTE